MLKRSAWSGNSRSSARATIAMSRADDTWFGLCNPLGLTKCNSCRPRRCPAAFMSSAKASTEPETPSATITATSLGDLTISILSALSSVTSVPGRNPIFDGAIRAARADMMSGVSRVSLPLRTASSAT